MSFVESRSLLFGTVGLGLLGCFASSLSFDKISNFFGISWSSIYLGFAFVCNTKNNLGYGQIIWTKALVNFPGPGFLQQKLSFLTIGWSIIIDQIIDGSS